MTEPAGKGPLAGITVVDLTRVLAGPYCTMMLRDLGARVIKVERPETGDDARAIGPFVNGESAYFVSLNRGKESVALDLKEARDREIFDALLERADVLVENYRPGTMERLGYGWGALHERFPRLIYAAVSGFGHTGPYRERPAYDLVVQAMGGIMSLTGEPGGAPTRVGTSMGDITAGMFTCAGINAALYERAQTGRGQKVDVAMLDSQVAILENAIARLQASGEVPGPIGSRHPSITPFDRFATSDGALVIAAGNDALFTKLCRVIERPDLGHDPRFESNALRTENESALKVEIEDTTRTQPTAHWLDGLAEAGVPCGAIQNVAQVLEDPQIVARNMVVSVEDPALGGFRVAGNPIKYSDHEDPLQRPGSPALDADREALLSELGLGDDRD
ncbi:MAG: CoA transferase [Myxococcota bacterium]|jgi:CoA:oxalate CoA-transferase|nr:CoA transferase [Myxococcota bacterium]